MSAHTCHARGCDTPVPPVMLMCRRHWYMVPRPIRLRVNAAYRPGQCDLNPMPSRAWLDAANSAINAVAATEMRASKAPA